MSYKLYTAYRLPYDGTISEMKTISNSLRSHITHILHMDMLEERISDAVFNYDKQALLRASPDEFSGLKLPEDYSPRYSAWFNLMVKNRGANQTHGTPEPYVTLFIDEETPEWLYLIPRNIPEDSLDDILLSNEYKAEEYGYWTSTERPDDVTKDKWLERKETWDRIGVWNKSVEESGWIVKIIADFMLRGMVWDSKEDIATPLFPEFQARVNRVVVEILQASLAEEVMSRYPSKEDLNRKEKESRFSELMRATMDAVHMVMDKDPRAVSLAAKASPFFKKNLTMADLRKES